MADENKTSNLGVWDWLLFAAMLTICTGIGIFYAIKEYCSTHSNKTGEFLIGRRNMQRLPVAISILVSFVSSILILGAPAEIYTSGTLFYIYVVGIILGIVLASLLFVPLLYPLKLTSSFEYLELRFQSKAAKLTGTILMIVQQILYMGIASYAPSTALEAVTGFPTHVTIITLGGVSTFYTLLGGMKAVVWTGVVQSIFMITGVLAIVVQGTIQVGGLNEVWKLNGEWGRLVFWEFNPDPTVRHSVWSLVIGGGVAWLGTFGVNQASVQRYCSVGSLKESRWVVLLNVIGVFVLVTLTSLSGLVMFAYYAKKGCDPLANGNVDNSNQLIPFLVMEILGYPGLPGIFVSCLFSGALGENLRPLVRLIVLSNLPSSSTSACLNALSAVTWEDIVKPLIHHRVSETKKIWIIKMIVAFYGAAGISFACIVQDFGGTVAQATLSFTGAATGPLLGIFLLGALFPWANSWGCVSGGILGLALPLWISVGAYTLPSSDDLILNFPVDNCTWVSDNTTSFTLTYVDESYGIQSLYEVSYLWYASIGVATVIMVGLPVSLISAMFLPRQKEIDSKYLISIFDSLFCCLPEKWRRSCKCGYIFENPENVKVDTSEMVTHENGKNVELAHHMEQTNSLAFKSTPMKGRTNQSMDAEQIFVCTSRSFHM